jgi:two-component system response regulator YesN
LYKLLIVDDEPIERSTLVMLINKYFSDIEIAGEASNGREAIAKAQELKPDIIFMDIKMPGINGIEAAQAIKAANRKIKVVIVTAYDYFEYAQESLKIGIDDFLLKPVLIENIRESLNRIINKINIEKKQEEFDAGVVRKIKEIGSYLQNELISSILLRAEEQQINEYFELLDIKFVQAYALIVSIGEGKSPQYITDGVRKKIFSKRVHEIAEQKLAGMGLRFISAKLNDQLNVLVFTEYPESSYNLKLFSLNTANKLKDSVEREMGICIDVGIGTATDSVYKLLDSFLEARVALKSAAKNGKAAHFGDLDVNIFQEEYPFEDEKQLLDKILKGEMEGAMLAAEKLVKWIVSNCKSISEARIKLFEIVIMITRSVVIYRDVDSSLVNTALHSENINNIQAINDIGLYMERLVTDVIRSIDKVKMSGLNSQIASAMEYIKKNYNKDLSLEEVAKAVALSPFYFSKLFKAQVGENFIDYLTRCRMTVAEGMLKEGNCSIKDACYKVGYKDPNYFSKIFRKYFGQSPSEYRIFE